MTDDLVELYLEEVDLEALEGDDVVDVLEEYARLRASIDADLMVYGSAFVERTDDGLEVRKPYEVTSEDDVETIVGDDVGGAEVYGSSPTDLGREAVDELYRSTRIAGAPFMKPLDPDGRGGDEE